MKKISPVFFDIFKDKPLFQAYSTRVGGFSKGVFNSLNLGLNTKDRLANVKQNRDLFFSFLGLSGADFVFPQQVHGDHIHVASKPGFIEQTDALVTNKKGLFLTIQTADCFPVFIYEPLKHVCAIIHSGWRGTSKNICGKTIRIMVETFNCRMDKMLVAIGAGIQQKNYQVDINTAKNFNSKFLRKDGENHFKLDVQQAIIEQILSSGVPKNQLSFDKTCTFESDDTYYSYRRDGKNSGRMMGIIGLE